MFSMRLYLVATVVVTTSHLINNSFASNRSGDEALEANITIEASSGEKNTYSHSIPSLDTSLDCPPWYLPRQRDSTTAASSSPCYCADIFPHLVHCHSSNLTSFISPFYCITQDGNSSSPLVGACPYSRALIDTSNGSGFWISLPQNISQLNERLCGPLHREGLLCGRCVEGYGISLHSNNFPCVSCKVRQNGWAWFLLSEILFQVVLFAVIYFFRITLNTDRLAGFLLFSQIVSNYSTYSIMAAYLKARGFIHLERVTWFLISFSNVWVLKLFPSALPEACSSESLRMLQAVALGYVSAFFPILLILLVYVVLRLRDCNFVPVSVVWLPYQRAKHWLRRHVDLKPSLIHAFASVLVLSYSKLAVVSYSLLFSVDLYDSMGNRIHRGRWFYDAGVSVFGREHLPYGILALIIFVTFVVAPPLLLFFYPVRWFRRCLHRTRLDFQSLHNFMDVFQGCYKAGTTTSSNGSSRDLRWFSGMYFLLRLILIGVRITAAIEWQAKFGGLAILLVIFSLCYYRPYKREVYNIIDTIFLGILACNRFIFSLLLTTKQQQAHMASVIVLIGLSSIPSIYFAILMLYHLVESVKGMRHWKEMILESRRRRQDNLELTSSEWPYKLVEEENALKRHVSKRELMN